MLLSLIARLLRRALAPPRRLPIPAWSRPRLELLEDRLTPSTSVSMPPAQSIMDTQTASFSSTGHNAIVLAGGDANPETVYVQVNHGTLFVTPGGSAVSGNGTALLTLTASEAAINSTLNSLIVTPPRPFLGLVTLGVLAQNDGNGFVSGATGINVSHINIAPTVTMPSGALAVNADASLVFSTANGNAVTVADADANGGMETVYVQVTGGTVTLGSTSGLFSFTGNGTSLVSFIGTLPQLNAALNGLTFTPATLFRGSAFLSVLINDNGNLGGAAKTGSGGAPIAVARGNVPPTINGPHAAQAASTNLLIFAHANGNAITVQDVDAGSGNDTVLVQVLSGSLSAFNTSGLAAFSGNGTHSLILTGTVAALNTALDGLIYQAPPGLTGDFLNVFVLDNGGPSGKGLSASLSTAITVTSGTDIAPTISGPRGTQTANAAGMTFAQVNGNAIRVTDGDADGATEAVYVQVLFGTLTATAGGAAVVTGSGTSLLSVGGTLPDINATLDTLHFTPAPGFTSDSISVLASDGTLTGSIGLPVAVTSAANLTPTITVPGSQTVSASGVLNFTLASGNAIRAADADSAGGLETIFLQTLHGGRLAVDNTVSSTSVAGNGTSSLALNGSVGALNQLLDGLRFAPAAGTSSDFLSVFITDNGNTGGAAMGFSAGVSIGVTA
jgi:hypothetical protein